jgi:3-methyl-2-oxobutanoate hydroxymethyltransferase
MYMTNQKLAVMTAYDYPSGTFADRAGSDIVLVGDSLGMVCLGYESTNLVTLSVPPLSLNTKLTKDMIHHSRAVHRALKTSYIVTDLPFASYESSPQQAFESAAKLLRDGHAEAVKLEGGKEMAATISHLVNVGVPVMGHVGLMPQRAKALGGFRVQGNTAVKVYPVYGWC